MNQETIKHLEFIQDIITRMNTNSFQIQVRHNRDYTKFFEITIYFKN